MGILSGKKSKPKHDRRETSGAVIPVVHEQVEITGRAVETGKVKISKRVNEHEELIDVPFSYEEVRVERLPVEQFVDEAPPVRTEGGVTIIPILEERYVLEKKLVLVEELHVYKEKIESHQPQTVKVLKEEMAVERVPPGQSGRDTQAEAAKPGRQ